MIYNPPFTEAELEVEFSKLRKLKYNQFRWWRMYDNPNPTKPKHSMLIDKIRNGDFDYSHFRYQAMWCEYEINKVYQKYGLEDRGRFVEETSLLRSRRKRLLEDYFKDEDSKLEEIAINFSRTFRLSKDEIKKVMETFGGTLEEMYIHLEKLYPPKEFKLPKSLQQYQINYERSNYENLT
jgi:hypothetical protein